MNTHYTAKLFPGVFFSRVTRFCGGRLSPRPGAVAMCYKPRYPCEVSVPSWHPSRIIKFMSTQTQARVLVVDDEVDILSIYARVLGREGMDVEETESAESAMTCFRSHRPDVIVTDLWLPGMDGIGLLREVRKIDLDVPVVLVTATPSLDSAIRAVEYGALQYVVKPVRPDEIVAVVRKAVNLGRLAQVKREALKLVDGDWQLGDPVALDVTFRGALTTLRTLMQPLVSFRERRVFGYEALMRSGEPRMRSPGQLLSAAERLARVHDLGRRLRERAAAAFATLEDTEPLLFVNLHPQDLLDPELFAAEAPLGQIASRVVLEVTERTPLDAVSDVKGRVDRLRELGFRVAIDDLGAGYAGLTAFSLLQPDVCKLDMALVRDVDTLDTKRKLCQSMVELCQELGILLVAEGVETAAECDTLVAIGVDILQGYLFAKPGEPFPAVHWHR